MVASYRGSPKGGYDVHNQEVRSGYPAGDLRHRLFQRR